MLAMSAAALAPGRAARHVPGGVDVLHHPVTVPIPRLDVPTAISVYDVQHHELPQLFSRGERLFRRWAYDGAARSADLVITSSEYSRERLREYVGAENVEVVHLGIDLQRFTPEPGPDDERLLAELGVPERFVIYPANLWPHKNHDRLLEAFARVADDELELVLTGATYGRTVSGERVRHLGFVPHAAVPALFRRARAMVFPSLYEGFGAPPLEAMACGCPAASSTRGSLAEMCGDAVLPFDPEDPVAITQAIDQITGDEQQRERLAALGPAHAAGFTWEAAAARHVELYGRIAA
jgi:glycosyltransferase involved in cell wall biosynthesis